MSISKVIILPEYLANQIAAGEVVERPAAIVKELVENAIDAGASRIRIEIRRAGKTEIKVVDNGTGMSRDDALLAFERHATSKIKTKEDLESVSTLGFRGEALPSIAAVSRLKLVTRTRDNNFGTQIRLDGGVLKDVKDAGCAQGTSIIVRNLFYNTPARRKFLRTDQTEMSHISEQVIRLALVQPGIQFRLYHQGRLIHNFSITDNIISRSSQIFGSRLLQGGQSIAHVEGDIEVSGFLAPPEMQRSTSHAIYTFVNNRYVRNILLNRTIIKCYQGLLPKDRFPVAVLSVVLPPELVDVNVHPSKSEVRFRDVPLILEALKCGISDGLRKLQKRNWNRPLVLPQQSVTRVLSCKEPKTGYITPGISHDPMPEEDLPVAKGVELDRSKEIQATFEAQSSFSSLMVIGQLGNSYILCEAPDGLVIIDQHAAHERILFDILSNRTCAEKESSQFLLKPQPLDLLPKEAEKLEQILPELQEIGFYIEAFGGNTFIIKAIPVILNGEDPVGILQDVVTKVANLRSIRDKYSVGIELRKSTACHAAIKANQRLTKEEIRELLKKLDQTENPSTCPHGRPLWWKITHDQIAKFFKRTQSPVGY